MVRLPYAPLRRGFASARASSTLPLTQRYVRLRDGAACAWLRQCHWSRRKCTVATRSLGIGGQIRADLLEVNARSRFTFDPESDGRDLVATLDDDMGEIELAIKFKSACVDSECGGRRARLAWFYSRRRRATRAADADAPRAPALAGRASAPEGSAVASSPGRNLQLSRYFKWLCPPSAAR